MTKPPRSSRRRRDGAKPSAVQGEELPTSVRGARQEVAFAAAREMQERVQAKAGPSSSRAPRRSLPGASVVDFTKLEGIDVQVPALHAVTDRDVDERLFALLRARAPVRDLPPGAPLALQDEVLLDAIGYVNGAPLTAQIDTWMRLSPNPLLPGLFEQIAAAKLGEPLVVRIVLPCDYPQEERAGQPAGFVVKTKAARRLSAVSLEDELGLLALGRGDTKRAVRSSVYEELLRERATDLVEQAKQRFLDEVERRLDLYVHEEDIEWELIRRWRFEEGDALALQGATSQEQAAARAAFLAHEGRRKETRRALIGERLLESAADELGLDASFHDVVTLVVQAAAGSTMGLSDLHTALTNDVALLSLLADKLRKSQSLGWLLEKATVRFVGSALDDELAGQ